ncbi:MAG: squalene--hopene cyclase [Gammaproteobacteria bacterium]|nr:squalene--hopene cyclase [Gammaproteobacteria bacterium]
MKLIEDVETFLSNSPIDNREVRYLEPQSDPVTASLTKASQALLRRQANDGHWLFELEADATIPAEYLLLQYFLDNVDAAREQRIAAYLRRIQLPSGAWSLFANGPGNVSATVKAYFALKLAGEDPDSPVMTRARNWIHANGGAESCNVFTRITLAVFGQMPWRTVPAMPVEIMFLPKWWVFNLSKVSYWSRCVIVPLLIIFSFRPVKHVRPEQGIGELFLADPAKMGNIDKFHPGGMTRKNAFLAMDRVLKVVDGFVPAGIRRNALKRAEQWLRAHMQGDGGIGGIYPAMANAAVALKLLGARDDDADFVRNLKAIDDLVLDFEHETYVQPCLSPVWDTGLALAAITEAGARPDSPAVQSAVDWLFDHQVFIKGDWSSNAPDLESGGWCFQFENDLYPDVDDTGMVLMSLLRAGAQNRPARRKRMAQALNWVLGMQNPDGSWAAFDIGNNCEYLNDIPFADHGALVDPGTADLTGRVIELLATLGYDASFPPIARALEFLKREQLECGAWYGRWGVNYLYGTWSVLCALGLLGEDVHKPYIAKAVAWLKSVQNDDGGWGETCNSYDDPVLKASGVSVASQTAWALLGLMAVGEASSETVRRGVEYLLRTQNASGEWDEEEYTGTGFPRVFYLRYHGYAKYFPVWALANYARAVRGIKTCQEEIRDSGPIDLGPLAVLAAA